MRGIFIFVLGALSFGCAQRAEVSFHLVALQKTLPAQEAETIGPGLSHPPDLPTLLAILESKALWSRIAPRVAGRVQDIDRLRASMEIRAANVAVTEKSIQADITITCSGGPEDEVRLTLEALVESYSEYLTANRTGEILRNR